MWADSKDFEFDVTTKSVSLDLTREIVLNFASMDAFTQCRLLYNLKAPKKQDPFVDFRGTIIAR